MSANPSTTPPPARENLLTVHRQWSRWTLRRLRFNRPDLTLTLHQRDWKFTIQVDGCDPSGFQELSDFFGGRVRPATCDIDLSLEAPENAVVVAVDDDYEAELWINGEVIPTTQVNTLLGLAELNMPEGSIDFDNDRDTWVFRTFNSLSGEDAECVQRAARRIGILTEVEIVHLPPSEQPVKPPPPPPKRDGNLDLISSRYLRRSPGPYQRLVERDEDDWRSFLGRRAKGEIVPPEHPAVLNFACLYDAELCGDSRLSELLTIYDRVDIMPELHGLEWLSKHQLSLTDLQELVRLKRVRLILPYSAVNYPSDLLDAVAEVDDSSLILSRALAARSIIRGQAKEPLLYAPLTSAQRAAVLAAMSKTIADERFRGLVGSYAQFFMGQHYVFMTRGALAMLGFGVGSYLGEVFLQLANKDARVELATCGAGIEWALGLDASYIPRDFGGYDETHNSEIVASYLGRTRLKHDDPTANRMHIITDGLLGVSGVPPLEVAKNFHSLPASRFRNVARDLMGAAASASDVRVAVDRINADVKTFERRAERLRHWKVGALVAEVGLAMAHHEVGAVASVLGRYLYELLEHRIPPSIKNELGDAGKMLAGLVTGSSIDAVIVSRSKKYLNK
jgi:hypothetical protein